MADQSTNKDGNGILLVDVAGVAKLLGVSKRTVERLATKGEIPAPVRLGERCVRWRVHELQEWVTGLESSDV